MTPESRIRQVAHEIGASVNPILVSETRGDIVESIHRGAFAIADVEGRVVASAGDVEAMVYPRSAIKLIQAVPLVESGAADAFNLSDQELALACASHSGEPRQVKAVAAWLARIGCAEPDLVCGPHPPSAQTLLRDGRQPTRLHNNCSGKHTGFLTLARHLGAPIKGYAEPDHPVQQRVIECLSTLSGVPSESFAIGIDGCGAPNFAMPLRTLATAFARVADPSGLAPARRAAVERLTKAIRAEPFYLAGTGRLCTRIIEAGIAAIPKTGAEGVYVAALPSLKLGLALKIDDGARAPAESLFIAVLVGAGIIASDAPLAREYIEVPILNTQGRSVGARRVERSALAGLVDLGRWR